MISFSDKRHRKLIRILHILSLMIFGFIIIFAADKTQYLTNHTIWFENYFEDADNKLSNLQKDIIHNSAAITSAVSEDNGIKVTLDSVTGNGYYVYYKVDIEFPEGMNTGYDYIFDKLDLLLNDDKIAMTNSGTSTMTLEDDDPTDNRYSLLLSTHMYYFWEYYPFDNGIVRTFHLEDLIPMSNEGEKEKIKGSWDFNIIFKNKGKFVELIDKPINVRGYNYFDNQWCEAEITSFSMSEFFARCEYNLLPKSKDKYISIKATAVMKDGRKFSLISLGGSGNYCYYQLEAPVSFKEIDYIEFSDNAILPFKK